MPHGKDMAYAALAATSALWSGNTITGRALADALPPVAFSFWRWTLVLAILAPLVAGDLRRHWPAVRRRWRTLAVLGLMSTALYHAWVFWALHYTTAINAQLLNSTIPLWVMLIGWAALGARPAGREWVGFAVSTLGVAAIIAHGDWHRLAALDLNAGDLMVLGAMINWAVYTILLARSGVALPGLAFVFVTGAFGVAGLLPFYLWELAMGRGAFALTPATIGGIAFTAVGASVIATVLFIFGLTRVGATRAALFTHLVPVFGALLGVLLLGERLGLHHLAGFGLILAGIAVANGLAPGRLRGAG
ncbi:MAG TPA: DMT family transporter [Burkholderiales bacterium]|nr:DMT family transporter [Burkholderiales bacterium]